MRNDNCDYEQAKRFSAATLHEAYAKRGALPSAVKPVSASLAVCGPAFTVLSPPRDNLWLHRAIYAARPGDVLVVDTGGFHEAGYWGEVMTAAAMERKLGGLVIDGCVRDGNRLAASGFPVFSRGLCIRGTDKDRSAAGCLNEPIRLGDVRICPGDLVVGDADGVVVVAQEHVRRALEAAGRREEEEQRLFERIAAGETTLDMYRL